MNKFAVTVPPSATSILEMSDKEKRRVMIETLVKSAIDSDGPVPDFAGDSTLPPPPILSPEQERKLWRKIDVRLLPMLGLMYFLSFMDRGVLSIQELTSFH